MHLTTHAPTATALGAPGRAVLRIFGDDAAARALRDQIITAYPVGGSVDNNRAVLGFNHPSDHSHDPTMTRPGGGCKRTRAQRRFDGARTRSSSAT